MAEYVSSKFLSVLLLIKIFIEFTSFSCDKEFRMLFIILNFCTSSLNFVNSSEKFSSLKYRLEECKKKLFRNNSNREKVNVNYDYNLRNSQINKRYLK